MVLNFVLTEVGKLALLNNQANLIGVIITNEISSLNVTTPSTLSGTVVFSDQITGSIIDLQLHIEFQDTTQNTYSAKTIALTFLQDNTLYIFAVCIPEENETELFYKSIAPLVASIDLTFSNAENITIDQTTVSFPDATTEIPGKVRLATQQEIESKESVGVRHGVITADGLQYLTEFRTLTIANELLPKDNTTTLGKNSNQWQTAYINTLNSTNVNCTTLTGNVTGNVTGSANELAIENNNESYSISLNTTNNTWKPNTTLNAQCGITVPFAVCNTQNNVAKKQITITGFKLEQGAVVYIQFTNANTASNPTLSINNGTEYAIKLYNNTSIGTSSFSSWNNDSVVKLIFNGTTWIIQDTISTHFADESQKIIDKTSQSQDKTVLEPDTFNDGNNTISVITSYRDILPETHDDLNLGNEECQWQNVWATTFNGDLNGTSANSTYSHYIGSTNTNKVASYYYSSSTNRALIPSVNYSSSAYVTLGNSNNIWGGLYCNSIGTGTTPVTKANITKLLFFENSQSHSSFIEKDPDSDDILFSGALKPFDEDYLGDNDHRWLQIWCNELYSTDITCNEINFYLLSVKFQPGDPNDPIEINMARGDMLDMEYVVGLTYSHIWFNSTSNKVEIDIPQGIITGSFKLLTNISCYLDGNTYTYIVPVLRIYNI